MACAAMAEAFDQIGAAIPDFRFRRISLEDIRLMEQRVPSRQQGTKIERKRQLVSRNLRSHRRLRHQISVERLQIGVASLGEMRIGKRRIEMPAVAMDALAHGAFEGGIRPRADASRDIRRDVGCVDRAERRFQRSPAGVENAVRAGMADRAIAEC